MNLQTKNDKNQGPEKFNSSKEFENTFENYGEDKSKKYGEFLNVNLNFSIFYKSIKKLEVLFYKMQFEKCD